MRSRNKILLGCLSMVLAMIGDYLLGYGTFSTSTAPDAYMGVSWNVVPDWRYALSSILGSACAPLFAVAAMELFRVMEEKHGLSGSGHDLMDRGTVVYQELMREVNHET